MKVTRPIVGNPYTARARETARRDGVRPSSAATSTERTSGDYQSARLSPADIIQTFGIPEEEFSPRVQSVISQLLSDVDTLRSDLNTANRRLRELEELADFDPLIPIPNRRAFVRELNRMMRFNERYGTPSTLVFIDMNDLKKINDTLGHEAGDQSLFHMARTLKDNLRGTDTIARLGGDEFGILLAQTDENAGQQKAEQLAQVVDSTPFHYGDETMTLKYAYGLYTFTGHEEAEDALHKADQAMYDHKRDMKGDNIR